MEKPKNGSEDNNGGAEKWEKNVKRRVYDALNVLYAAGVLNKKDNTKQVYCAPILSTSFSLDELEDDNLPKKVSPYDDA
jgi:hypothetical protein